MIGRPKRCRASRERRPSVGVFVCAGAREKQAAALQDDPLNRLASGNGELGLRPRRAFDSHPFRGTEIFSGFALDSPALTVYIGELQCRGLGIDVETLDDDGKPARSENDRSNYTATVPSMQVYIWSEPDGEKCRIAYFPHVPKARCHPDQHC